jgi:hypothetical protein
LSNDAHVRLKLRLRENGEMGTLTRSVLIGAVAIPVCSEN